jgi:hypothetical protein
MENEIAIDMCVQGNVRQFIKLIDKDITPEELVAGLKSGRFCTSFSFDGRFPRNAEVLDLNSPDFKTVGYVTSQEPMDNMEYNDFKLSPDQ